MRPLQDQSSLCFNPEIERALLVKGQKIMSGRSSLGFLGRFGRSSDLISMDQEFRRCGLHPAQIPEGVKLAAANLVREHQPSPSEADYIRAATLMSFVAVGQDNFGETLGAETRGFAAQRLENAFDRPNSLDAQLVLLMLHAKLIQPAMIEAYGLEIDDN